MTHLYSIVLRTSAFSIRIVSSTRVLGVKFDGILPEAAPVTAYPPVDFDGVVFDVPPEIYESIRLFVNLADCLDAGCGLGIRHAAYFSCTNTTVRPNAPRNVSITTVISLKLLRRL